LKLGARSALGVDIDQEAVDAAEENARTNGITTGLELAAGSLKDILAGRFGLRRGRLVLANILAVVLERLLDEGLAGLITPDGSLVLSGILAEQSAGVEAAARRTGLQLAEKRHSGDWVALQFIRT
jgi:ribosomal protein L11 methyltransferase